MGVRHIIAISFGVVFIIAGAVAFVVIGNAQKEGLKDALTMDGPNDSVYNSFVNPRDPDARPFYTKYTLYNLTNVAAVKAGTEKPNYASVGPFTYRTYINRENVVFSADGVLMNMNERWTYEYQPSTQFPVDTVQITNFNGFYAVMVLTLKSQGGEAALNVNFLAGVFGTWLKAGIAGNWGSAATVCVAICSIGSYTSGAITFTTTQSTAMVTAFSNATTLGTYMTMVGMMYAGTSGVAAQLDANFAAFGINHQSTPTVAYALLSYLNASMYIARNAVAATYGATDGLAFRTTSARVAIFGPDPLFLALANQSAGFVNNNTLYGASILHTGKAGEPFMNLDYYQQVWGKPWTNVYGPNITTEGRGSSTAPFQRDLPEKFYVYSGETQRRLGVKIGRLTSVYDIDTTRYSLAFEEVFAVDPAWNNTVPGFLAVGAALGGLPVFMGDPNYGPVSTPAAYGVPQYLRDAVTGIDSSKDEESFLDIEALTGLPLNLRKAVQISMLLNFTGFQDCPNLRAESKVIMVPMLWSAQESIITASMGSKLYQGIVVVRNVRIALIVVFVGVGTLLVVLGIAFLSAELVDSKGDKYADSKVHPTSTPGDEELK